MRKYSVALSIVRCMKMKSRLRQSQNGRALADHHLLAADEERGLEQVEAELHQPQLRQRARDIGLVHEAVAHRDGVEIVVEMAHLDALVVGHVRDVLGLDLHQHDALVQHLVVLEVVQQRRRHDVGRWAP